MAQVNNIMKFFQFLSETCGIKSKDDMLEAMDGNADGHLVKSEFKEFMKNWDGNFTDTELNQFWKAVDTKTSGKITTANGTLKELNALDDKEMENMDVLLGAYSLVNEKLDEYIADLVELGSSVMGLVNSNQLIASVKESVGNELSSFIKSSAKKDNFEDLLTEKLDAIVPKSMAKTLANVYSHALLTETVRRNSDLNQLGYKGGEDFEAVINTYISKLGEQFVGEDGEVDFNLEQVVEDIQNLVNAFIASVDLKTPALDGDGNPIIGNVANDSVLVEYGFNNNQLNSLQLAVLSDHIAKDAGLKNEVAAFKNSGLEADFNSAVINFVNAQISAGTSFKVLMESDIAAEFKTSKEYTALVVRKDYSDINVGDEIYNRIVLACDGDETIAKAVAERDTYNAGGYKDIVANIAKQVANGDIEADKAAEAVVDAIIANLSSFVRSGNISIEDLAKLYSIRANAADTIASKDADSALQQHRQAALDYCNAIAAKNPEFKDVLDRLFGGNFTTQINSMYPDEIKEVMASAIAEMSRPEYKEKMVDPRDYVIQWNYGEGKDKFEIDPIAAGKEGTFTISGNVTDKSGKIEISTAKIEYEVSASNGATATINPTTGEVKFKADKDGNYLVTVTAKVNGVVVGSQEITITVKKKEAKEVIQAASWQSFSCANVEAFNIAGGGVDKNIAGFSFKDLYNSNAYLCLMWDDDGGNHDSDYFWDKYGGTIKTRLQTVAGGIVKALAAQGLDESLLTQAAADVTAGYGVGSHTKDDANRYKNDWSACAQRCIDDMKKNGYNYHMFENETNSNDIVVMVSFKTLVDQIMNRYIVLGGTF